MTPDQPVDVALGWDVDIPHDHIRHNDHLNVYVCRTMGL